MNQSKHSRIIGIDPGSHRIGFAILEKNVSKKIQILKYGTIEIPPKTEFGEAMIQLRKELISLVDDFKPQLASVEDLFFSKNVKTAAKVFQSRGVILLTLAERAIPILEPTVSQIKKGVTTSGKADKNQIKSSLKLLLQIEDLKGLDDSWDAVACAFVGFSMQGSKLF
ncbi:MAG: crossover junction endodeoxyribonuclease RuvC [Leptospiraceae bacterium]|nr:crossover junction endodeoxyribonuclease RuvC [Leptospiraceae bacterium]MCP5513035.1 crossover junction endodeoxyribonuclease RuvC [Leptospiraceae bacterium]